MLTYLEILLDCCMIHSPTSDFQQGWFKCEFGSEEFLTML